MVRPAYPDFWGLCNQRFAELALFGPSNTTLADEISAEVATWSSKFLPYDNFTLAGEFCVVGKTVSHVDKITKA